MSRFNTKIFFIFALILVNILCVSPVEAAKIENIRLGDLAGKTARVVVDLSQRVDFKIFPLSNPTRVVIDLPNTSSSLNSNKIPKQAYLKNLRFGQASNNGTRVVLEFDQGVVIKKSFLLSPQSGFHWRLVIDLEILPKQTTSKQVTTAWYDNSVEQKKSSSSYASVSSNAKKTIVVDAGHGGKDPGAIGVSGVYEKHLTLAMAKQLKRLLENTGRYKVHLTRDKDVAISLFSRRNYARKVGADLFMSVHADSFIKSTTRGLSIYTLSETASDKEAEKLAEKENKADIIAGLDFSGETQEVTDILIDLARRETNNHSSFFAEKAVQEIRKVVRTLPNTHRFAGFAVLKAPDVPSVLIEMGYLSNKEEEKLLRQEAYREKLAKAIVVGVDSYFSEKHKANFN